MRPHIVHWLESFLPGGLAAVLAPTWFTCVGLAGVATLFAMLAIARRHRLDSGAVASLVLWCYVVSVAAGIAVPATIDAAEQALATGHAHVRWAGMTSFWGYLAGGCAVAVVCRTHGVPLARFADLATAPLGLALMLARLGCFVAGCDYGKVSSLPWAMRFPAHSPAWQDHVTAGLVPADRAASLPVHPTQLYEAALGLALAVGALVLARRPPRRDGHIFVAAACGYALGRLAIEDLRGDAGRGVYLGVSSGQIFSLLVLAAVAAGIALRRVRLAALPATSALAVALVLATSSVVRAQAAPAPPAPPTGQPVSPYADPRPGAPQQPPLYRPTAPPPPPGAPPPGPPPPGAPPPGYSQPGYPGGVAGAAAGTGSMERASLEVGALVGAAAAFNRRRDQVAPLAGGSISIGFGFRQLGVWLDVDSLGNRDASHGTVLASVGAMAQVGSRVAIGGRIGAGATLVNFVDPAFRDVAGATGRFEALVDCRLGESWVLWVRPLALDIVSAADLGGPIATWQARIGLAYRFGFGQRAVVAAPSGPVAPAAPIARRP